MDKNNIEDVYKEIDRLNLEIDAERELMIEAAKWTIESCYLLDAELDRLCVPIKNMTPQKPDVKE